MSYPDLGCFAECLTCELCGDALNANPPGLDLSFDWDDYDRVFGPDLDLDWDPPDIDNSIDLPSPSIDLGPVDVSPTWDPWGIEVGGEF